MARYKNRKDANQAEVEDALRMMGASVLDLSQFGKGVPDLAVGIRGLNFFVEVKTPAGRLTPSQVLFHQDWRGNIIIARSGERAIESITDVLQRFGA